MPKTKYKKEVPYPVYEALIDEDNLDDTGIRFVSIVSDPAIEIKGMFFSENKLVNQEFKAIADKKILCGPAMIPNKRIYRADEDGEYYIFFSPSTIQKMVEKFNRNNNNRSINVDHSNRMVNGYIQQNWITADAVYDKSKYYGFNLPIGSWFVEMKIEDDKFWEEEVKGKGKYSFSIEGMLYQSLTPYKMSKNQELSSLVDELSDEELLKLVEFFKQSPI